MASELTKADWQYIAYVVQEKFNKSRPTKGEPAASKEWEDQEKRIMTFLLSKAY